ncbi:MAG: peroxiredoxin family protein [Planctomycetales bacterium]
MTPRIARYVFASLLSVFCLVAPTLAAEGPPKVGDKAPDFELMNLHGEKVELSKSLKSGPVVLVVLRGYPGYQCPLCSKQFAEFLKVADEFKAAKATVLFVYPGPADKLKEYAQEFTKGKEYPEHFQFLLDPNYNFTTAYALRWDAKNETAYPSTFIIDKGQKVTFAKVSKTHGGRTKAADILKALKN